MEYRCKLVGISQLNVGPKGFIMPLCETCRSQDCTNPIEKIKLSIVGITKEIKVYNKGINPKFVVECEGYIQ